MADIIQLLKDFLPIEIAILAAIFIYLLLLFKGIAEKFISLSEKQANLAEIQASYLAQRLDAVEKTLGISDRAFDFQEKQIKKLQEVTQQQEIDISESLKAKQLAEMKLHEAEDKLQETIHSLDLKAQQVSDLQAALTRVEITSKADAILRLNHELLAHMQSVIADAENLQLAQELKLTPDELGSTARRILNQAELTVLLLQNTQLAVRVGDQDLYAQSSFSILDLIKGCMHLFDDWAKQKRISFRLQQSGSDDGFIITADKSKLRVAFSNLIQNAVKYSYENSDVVINLAIKDKLLYVTITNIGVGINSDEISKIFQAGYRGALGRDKSRTGTGMGLFVARSIVQAHSGQVRVAESVSLENGYKTTFEVTIPTSHRNSK